MWPWSSPCRVGERLTGSGEETGDVVVLGHVLDGLADFIADREDTLLPVPRAVSSVEDPV